MTDKINNRLFLCTGPLPLATLDKLALQRELAKIGGVQP